jgi:hypothetical protein
MIHVVFGWTGRSVAIIHQDGVRAEMILSTLNKNRKRLPKGYRRTKRKRAYCHAVDKKIQRLIGTEHFHLSDYVGKQYRFELRK